MASRERTLYLDAEVSGRSFSFENEILSLVGEPEPEIITAYFAEKIIEYKEEENTETFTYKFNSETELKTAVQKTNIANIIRSKLTFDGDKKYTDNQKIITAFTKETHNKDDEITIVALKKEKKEYYKKLSSTPMGYQVYLVAETKKLEGKKIKIKIHEGKNTDQDNKQVLKLVKAETDVLPVLVFAKNEDKTTDTEVADWIEIEVKKEDQKILNKTEGTDIEVAIKKIQLRPKTDKMASKTEDAVKSFEGWQEALYIREDETEDGKKAAKEEEDNVTARAAEIFTNLTRDADADKKENKKSFPKTISGPKTIEIGKDAVYTLDTYNDNATDADKNNIQWSLYKLGDPKTTYTIINTKSKTGLFTYAKMELVGDKNQLTIVFDKALKGKKVQIEPFRGKPDINNKKDYVRTTTVNKVTTPKVTKRDKASLYLKTQCDSIENEGEVIDNEFLNGSYFKLETPDTIHIYDDGKMNKLNMEGLKKVKYRYHDKNGDIHKLGEFDLIEVDRLNNGTITTGFRSDVASKTLTYNKVGVDAKETRIYPNGDVITKGDFRVKYREYKKGKGKVKLIKMKELDYVKSELKIKFKFHETLRTYSNPELFAGFIGALADSSFSTIECTGSSYEDSSCYPSTSHVNGQSIDTTYLNKKTDQQKFIDALWKFGFKLHYIGSSMSYTHGTKDKYHNDHLHSGSFTPNY